METSELQAKVFEAVQARGYSAEAQGFTPPEYLYHQWLKLVEEVMELGACFSVVGQVQTAISKQRRVMQGLAEIHFRARDFGTVSVYVQEFIKELADVGVPYCVMGETLNRELDEGIDAAGLALAKATQDKDRGKSK